MILVAMFVACPVVAQVVNVLNGTGGSFPKQLYPQAAFFYQFVDPATSLTYYGPDSTTGKCNMMGYWSTYNTAQILNGQQVPVPSSWTSTDKGSQYKYKGTGTAATLSFLKVEEQMCRDQCSGFASGFAGTSTPGTAPVLSPTGAVTTQGTAAVSTPDGTLQCPYDSCVAPRQDYKSRTPLSDIGASDSLPVFYTSQAASCRRTATDGQGRTDLDFFPDLKLFPAVAGAVVPIFNIPALNSLVNASSTIPLVLDRLTVKKIFNGEIRYWNDAQILANNAPGVTGNPRSQYVVNALTALGAQPIYPVVRQDSSGTSEAFTNALALMDPLCAFVGGATGAVQPSCQVWQDSSVGYQKVSQGIAGDALGTKWYQGAGSTLPQLKGTVVVPGTSAPKWCGQNTDEMFTVTMSGCTTSQTVTLGVVNPNGSPDTVSFACDATAAQVQQAFGLTYSGSYSGSTAAASTTSKVPFGSGTFLASSNIVSGTPVDNLVTPYSQQTSWAGTPTTPTTGWQGAGQGYSVQVLRSGTATGYTYTIGYWDPMVVQQNWYTPSVLAVGSGLTANVYTFQEGGLANLLTASTTQPTVSQVVSFFVSTSVSTAIALQWKDATGALKTTSTVTPNLGVLSTTATTGDLDTLKASINGIAAGAVSGIVAKGKKGPNSATACFYEYQITFTAPTSASAYSFYYFADSVTGLQVVDMSSGTAAAFSTTGFTCGSGTQNSMPTAFTATYTNSQWKGVVNAVDIAGKSFGVSASSQAAINAIYQPFNYAPFYMNAPSINTAYGTNQGNRKVTCYMRFAGFNPWSIFTGQGNPGLVSEVLNRPYTIGYSVLGDAITRSLNVAQMINKAGKVVAANQNSVAYAVMDKGGSIDPVYNYAQLGDASSTQAWPMAAFTYWLLRGKAHIGSCARRQAAMSFLYNFYSSASVTLAAGELGFATLPGFIATTQQQKLATSMYCNDGTTLALQKYITNPTLFLSPLVFNKVLSEYLDAYKTVNPVDNLQGTYVDDSRALWATYTASPTKYAGVFTMFGSKADKIANFAPDLATPPGAAITNMYTNAFAHMAVTPIYKISALTSPLILTPAIIGGILAGTIDKWDNAAIVAANAANVAACSDTGNALYKSSNCLPNKLINVAARGDATDVNAVLLRFLTLDSKSTDFAKAYTASNKGSYYAFDFTTTIPSTRLSLQYANDRVDAFVYTYDNSFGYFALSDVAPPSSTTARFCADNTCTSATSVNPNSNGVAIAACQNDANTVVNPNKYVNTYDLQVSTAAGCYPIVGTVDLTILNYGDTATCKQLAPSNLGGTNYTSGSPQYTLATTFQNRITFSAWAFGQGTTNTVDTSTPLFNQFSIAATSTAARAAAATQICNINCQGTKVGYDYCNYRDCTWAAGDYLQVQSACDGQTLKYTVTYQLLAKNPSGLGPCILNPATVPPASILIDCTSVAIDSYLGRLANALSIVGMVVCAFIGIYAFAYREEKVLRKSQPVFIYLSIFGGFLMNLSIQAFIGPNLDGACVLRPWSIDLSSTIMFSPLLMKLHRIDVLFRMSKKLKKIKIPDYRVALQVFGLCCVDIVILILWSTVQKPFQQFDYTYNKNGLLKAIPYDACSTTLSSPFECVMIAWKACLLAGGVYKAIATWDHPSDIAEVKHFFLAIYNVSVVGGAMYFFSLFGAQNPGTMMIMRVVGIFVSSTLPILIIMVPKFTVIQYKAITGKSLWALSGKSSNSEKDAGGSQASQIEVVQSDTNKLQAPIGSVRLSTVSVAGAEPEGKKSEA